MLTWVLAIAGSLLVLAIIAALVLHLVGKKIPEEHTASATIEIPAVPTQVFAVIDDIATHPTWNADVTKVEILPDKVLGGKGEHGGLGGVALPQCRMHMGRNSFVLTRTRCEPPRLLERVIEDDKGPFAGTWLYTLAPAVVSGKDGTHLRLTETGRIRATIPRALMKHFFGYHVYLNSHLTALAAKFGSDNQPRKA